ncbi:hypothetical protein AgCh_019593 [Apium graveolens]
MATNQEISNKIKEEVTLILDTSQNKLPESADMDEVREENGRLKLVLTNIMKDYKTLQQHIDNISSTDHHPHEKINRSYDDHKDAVDSSHEEDDLVSLSLGRSSSLEAKNKDQITEVLKKKDEDDHDDLDHGLALRLDGRSYELVSSEHADSGVSRNQSPRKIEREASNDQTREPRKDAKMLRSGDEENVLQQNPAKKARVSVRAICSGPTVQRCPENMAILITTYEGTHNHPLPPAATAMASTTSAAVSMLKASSTSTSQPSFSFPATTSTNINSHPFYVPNTTVSTFHSHPTITLDLTTPSASSRYNKYSSSFFPTPQPIISYSPAACLNFSAPSSSSTSFEHWTNHNVVSSTSTYCGTQPALPSKTTFYQPYSNYPVPNKNINEQTDHQFSTEKIAAATKEITSNPRFQTALAAAISSIVGRGGGVAESMESHLGAASAASLMNRASTVVSSISQQAEKKDEYKK